MERADYVRWSDTELTDRLQQLELEAAAIKKELRNRSRQSCQPHKDTDCGLTLREISRYSR